MTVSQVVLVSLTSQEHMVALGAVVHFSVFDPIFFHFFLFIGLTLVAVVIIVAHSTVSVYFT